MSARRRGHVAEKGGRFYAVVDLGRDELTRKRRRKWSIGFPTAKEADAELVRLLAALDTGERVDPTKMTLGAFMLDRWLPIVEPDLSPSTQKTYRVITEAHVVPYIGHHRLDRLDATTIDRLYATLRESGGRQGRGLAPKTIRNVHGVLSSALTFAVKKGLIVRNPVERAEAPSVGRSETPSPWDTGELRAFVLGAEADRVAALWRLLATTGMRRSEALGLGWSAVDLDRASLAITHTVVEGEGGPIRREATKTRSSRRRVALDAGTVSALREHRLRQLEERLAWGAAYQDLGLVFAREDGSLIRPSYVSRRFDRLVQDLGLRRVRLHDIRHSWASVALLNGVPMKVVQERLGHSSIQITMDLYSHVLEGLDRSAADTVATAVFG